MKYIYLSIFSLLLFSCNDNDKKSEESSSYSWEEKEKKICERTILNLLGRSYGLSNRNNMEGIFNNEFGLSSKDLSTCLCQNLEQDFKSYKDFERNHKNDESALINIASNCIPDESDKGNWSKGMKRICNATVYEILGFNRDKTNCICEKLEMDYKDMFDLAKQYTDGIELEEYREGLLEDCSNYYRSEPKTYSRPDNAYATPERDASSNVYGY